MSWPVQFRWIVAPVCGIHTGALASAARWGEVRRTVRPWGRAAALKLDGARRRAMVAARGAQRTWTEDLEPRLARQARSMRIVGRREARCWRRRTLAAARDARRAWTEDVEPGLARHARWMRIVGLREARCWRRRTIAGAVAVRRLAVVTYLMATRPAPDPALKQIMMQQRRLAARTSAARRADDTR